MERADITGIVLCGGRGRRFGGAPKALAKLHGRPLLDHVLKRLAPQVSRVLLSVGQSADPFSQFGLETIVDVEPGTGPLGGVVAALPAVRTRWVLTCPADTPCLPTNLVGLLAADAERVGVAVPHDGTRRQNLFVLMRHDRALALARFFAAGGRAIHRWLDAEGIASTDLSQCAGAFRNVNTRQDLEQAMGVQD